MLDDLAGINQVWLHNDLKVLDLQAIPGQLSRLSTNIEVTFWLKVAFDTGGNFLSSVETFCTNIEVTIWLEVAFDTGGNFSTSVETVCAKIDILVLISKTRIVYIYDEKPCKRTETEQCQYISSNSKV